MDVLIFLGGKEAYSQGFDSYYVSVWSGLGGGDISNTPWISPQRFLSQTQWIDIGLRGFPPRISHNPIFEISAESV